MPTSFINSACLGVNTHPNPVLSSPNCKASTGLYTKYHEKTGILFTMDDLSNFKEFIIKLNYSKVSENTFKTN